MEDNVLNVLPFGYKMQMLQSTQPTTTHEAFVRVTATEIAAGFSMPYNIAMGDSSRHNYASGRLDWQPYMRKIDVERADAEAVVMDPIFEGFLEVAQYYVSGVDWDAVRREGFPHEWQWTPFLHIDIDKETKGQERRLSMRTTSPQRECAREGLDHETVLAESLDAEFRERRLRIDLQKQYGLSDDDMARTDAARPRDSRGQKGKPDDSGDAEATLADVVEEAVADKVRELNWRVN
jgi:capsid protein